MARFSVKEYVAPKRGTVEKKLEELVLEDLVLGENKKGVNTLYTQLVDEGTYIGSKGGYVGTYKLKY